MWLTTTVNCDLTNAQLRKPKYDKAKLESNQIYNPAPITTIDPKFPTLCAAKESCSEQIGFKHTLVDQGIFPSAHLTNILSLSPEMKNCSSEEQR